MAGATSQDSTVARASGGTVVFRMWTLSTEGGDPRMNGPRPRVSAALEVSPPGFGGLRAGRMQGACRPRVGAVLIPLDRRCSRVVRSCDSQKEDGVGLRSLLVFERMCRDVAQLRGDSAPWIGDRVGSVDPAPTRSHDRELVRIRVASMREVVGGI